MSDLRRLTFFFPYREISGVPVLFARLARYLATEQGVRTAVGDFTDGHMAKVLADVPQVEIRTLIEGQPFEVGPDETLVMQAVLPATMRPELRIHPDARVLFWCLFPFNLVPTLVPHPRARDFQARHPKFNRWVMKVLFPRYRKKLASLVEEMYRQGSILFMDGTNVRSVRERLGAEVPDPTFVPVPCDPMAENKRLNGGHPNPRHIKMAWVGRLADFKMHILLHLLERLSAISRESEFSIHFDVVGTGPLEGLLDESALEHEGFRVRRLGVVEGVQLDTFLLGIDLLTAMGTSALEGAKLGVPTVLLDAAYGPIRGPYRFRWLFEVEDFCLAEVVGERSFEPDNKSIEEILARVRFDFDAVSTQSYEYCMEKHAMPQVAHRFTDALDGATFRFRDLDPDVLKKSFFRKCFELVRDGRRTDAPNVTSRK